MTNTPLQPSVTTDSRWSTSQVAKGCVIASRGRVMGLLPPGERTGEPWNLLLVVDGVLRSLELRGVATSARWQRSADGTADDAFLDRILAVTEENPMPEGEWAPLREQLGDDLVATLLDVSEGSVRRYASGQRTTPDPIAARLHWLALVVADLEGSYNAIGVRRWFGRPRTVLGSRSPQDLLGGGFDPDGAPAAEVRGLARSLAGLGAT